MESAKVYAMLAAYTFTVCMLLSDHWLYLFIEIRSFLRITSLFDFPDLIAPKLEYFFNISAQFFCFSLAFAN